MKTPAWTLLFALCACTTIPSSARRASLDGALASAEAHPQRAWVRALEPTADRGGVGSLEARAADVDGTVHLGLTQLDIRVEPAGHLAAFEVEHRFHNDSDDILEGTFRFTLPPGAVVTGLAMNIGEEMMEGEFVDRDKARETFEKIVDSMRDPALLEWEQGKLFKLRVFPIEAHADKRVVLRYMAPLGHAQNGTPEIAIPLAAADLQRTIDHVSVRVAGGSAAANLDLVDVVPDLVLRIPTPSAWGQSDLLTEEAEGSRFTAVRIQPRWDELSASAQAKPERRRVVLLVDSSRSALEAWGLVKETVATLTASLGAADEVALLTSDLLVDDRGSGFAPASSTRASLFVSALDDIEPDGASDLGSAIAAAQALLGSTSAASTGARDQIIYIGDGAPTWGELDPGRLGALVDTMGPATELHSVALGKRADESLLRALSGRRGGAVLEPSRPEQIAAAADFLANTHRIRSLRDVHLEVDGIADVVLPPGGTWFEGQAPIAYVRTPADAELPTAISLHAEVDGTPVVQRIALNTAAATDAKGISRLWASREIEAVSNGGETSDMKKEQIIALSQNYGVLSRHTSLLVLESEEAYEHYQIERKQEARRLAAAAGDPAVSGADLESVGLSPGDLQPGDPEIDIPAPADALSVAVVFPFGETKLARWDEGAGHWTVRFLVADDTAPGVYAVRIRITHADGRVEMASAEYTIDMTAPAVDVEIVEVPGEPGTLRVIVRQRLTEADARREQPEGVSDGSVAETLDLGRVRLVMPDGQTLMLRRMDDGEFARNWTPRQAVQWPATVQVAVTDRALNTRRDSVSIAGPAR